jgi:hypothetical protein
MPQFKTLRLCMETITIVEYETPNGRCPFKKWIESFKVYSNKSTDISLCKKFIPWAL